MNILTTTMSRLSATSQTSSRTTNTFKSRHSRILSYDEVKTLSTVDSIVALCAGSDAKFRLERKRMLAYFQCLPNTPNTISSENWANVVGGHIIGVREAPPSFRTPWAEPNSGITFRYRAPGSTPSTSCGTNCTTFDHHSYRPSVSSSRSSIPPINTPPTPSICDVPTGNALHIVDDPSRMTHKISSPAAASPEAIQGGVKSSPLILSASASAVRDQECSKRLLEKEALEQSQAGGAQHAECDEHGSVHDDEDQEEEQVKAEPAKDKKLCDEPLVRSRTISVPRRATVAEDGKHYQQPPVHAREIPLKAGLAPDEKPYQETHVQPNHSLTATGLAALRKIHQKPAISTKKVGFEGRAAKRKAHYQQSSVQDIPKEVVPFKSYPNTYNDLTNPTEPSPPRDAERRREVRDPFYFANTPWKISIHVPGPGMVGPGAMQCLVPGTSPHRKEFIATRDYDPLYINQTACPRKVAETVAKKEEIIRKALGGRPTGAFNIRPLRKGRPQRPQPNRRFAAASRPAPRPAARPAAARRAAMPRAPPPTNKGQKRGPPVKMEYDPDCAIESDTEDEDEEDMEASAEWDPTCYVEPERSVF